MAKKPTQDILTTVYGIEATDAQQKLHALKKANKELAAVQAERRREMVKLEAQGKKESDAYKKLAAANRESGREIKKVTDAIREQENQMGVSSLTMNQLRSRAKFLRNELNNISKELEPERWAQTNKKLGETNNRMTELRQNASELNKNLGKSMLSKGAFASFFGNVYAQLFMKLTAAVTKVKEFIKDSVELAATAQGIDHAFNRIANKDYLKSLREQTKGLVSDFTLMKSAVRAENFDIPLTQLGTLLEFAQNRARDTGESVDYLVESIINGIGRKSPLILDNLGISTVRLQQEVKKTGDFASAVGKIIEEEMAKSGPAIDTAADAATRKKVAWENLQLATGKFFLGFKSGWDGFTTRFAEGLTKLISGQEKATKQFDDQIKKVAELESSIIPLTERYDELKSKTNLSRKEQEELTRTINALAAAVPGAVTEFDKYGNALAVNTQKVWAFVAAEKAKLEVMNREAIESTRKDIEKAEQEIQLLQNRINKGSYSKSVGGSITGYSQTVNVAYTDEDMAEMKKQLAIKEGVLIDHQEKLKFLDGTSIEDQINIQKAGIKKREEFNELTKKELESYIKQYAEHKDKFVEIAREVYNSRFAVGGDDDEKDKPKGKTKAEIDKEKLDYALKEETKILKQQLADRSITQEQFDRELEKKTLESLQKKLEISGLDKDARIDIEQQILDFKIKALELEKNIEKERLAIRQQFERAVMTDNDRELQDIRDKGNKRIEELKQQLEKGLITESQFNEYKSIVLETQEKELEDKRRIQSEALAAKKLTEQNKELEAEKMILMEQYASGLISKQAYNDALLALDQQYALQSLEISNLSDAEKLAARKKLLDLMVKKQDEETKKQEEAQKKRVELYSEFSEQIGTMLGGVIAGNEDIVKSSLKAIINMALDALEAQVQIAIAGVTAQGLAQSMLNPTALARAAIKIALIKAAFSGVKAIVNSALSGSKKTQPESSTTITGKRVVTGRQTGGFFDVEREQDKKRYIAKFDPTRRGFINRPTVLVGDGPAGKSREWVAGNDALQNPTVAPFIRLLDEAQQAGNIRTIDLNHLMRARMAGFQSGGFISQSSAVETSHAASHNQNTNNFTPVLAVLTDLKDLLHSLKTNGVKAPVVLSELQRKQELLNVSQKIGSK